MNEIAVTVEGIASQFRERHRTRQSPHGDEIDGDEFGITRLRIGIGGSRHARNPEHRLLGTGVVED